MQDINCTRVTWIYMMRNKSDVGSIFPTFLKHVKTQYGFDVKTVRSDNAPAFPQLIKDHGIIHQFSCAYTPQQNLVVERKHQHLLNVARALLFQSNIPLAYWSDCVLTVVFLINRTPSLLLNKLSPYEVLCKKAPDYKFLRSFGCLCYASTYAKDRNKFTPRASSCIFLGYSSGYKGYKVLDIDNNQIFVSRNVTFHETIFPFKDKSTQPFDNSLFTETVLPMSTPVSLDPITTLPAQCDPVIPVIPSPVVHVIPLQPSTTTGSTDTVASGVGQVEQPIARSR